MRSHRGLVFIFLSCTGSWSVLAMDEGDGEPPAAPSAEGAGIEHQATVPQVRIARSRDGRRFADTGNVFVDRAAAPDLVRLHDGRVLACIDVWTEDGPMPFVSFSRDEGRAWDEPRAVRFVGFPQDAPARPDFEHPRHLEAVVAPSGVVKVFFITGPVYGEALRDRKRSAEPQASGSPPPPADAPPVRAPHEPSAVSRSPAPQVIRAAVSRDGVHYRIDPHVELPISAAQADVSPVAAIFRNMVIMYADTGATAARSPQSAGRPLLGFLSQDGRRFARFGPRRTEGVAYVGDLWARDDTLTGYFLGEEGLALCESTDARTFRSIACDGPRGLCDASVVRLKDGGYFMLYEAARGAAEPAVIDSVVSTSAQLRQVIRADVQTGGGGQAVEASTSGTAQADEALAVEDTDFSLITPDVGASRRDRADSSATRGGADGHPGRSNAASQARSSSARPDHPSPGTEANFGGGATDAGMAAANPLSGLPDGDEMAEADAAVAVYEPFDFTFAPTCTFSEYVDYAAWYRTTGRGSTPDDANAVYTQFMPGPNDPPDSKREWADWKNMFSDGSPLRHPGPWSPQDHPDWEASRLTSQGLGELYRQATRHAGYASPDLAAPDDAADEEAAREQSLLLNILLPNLASHRALAKQMISDAWRTEHGHVDPVRMRESWETVLRGARHLQMGATLIEELVGAAEQALVQENARWALREGVFETTEQLENALRTLERFDRYDRDPAYSIRGEHAMAMDTLQYMFWPAQAQGLPQPIPQRIRKITGTMGDDAEDLAEAIEAMTAPQIQQTVEQFDAYYRALAEQMRIGYPLVRASDLGAAQEIFSGDNPVARMLMPSLGRYYKLRARNEASRRATRLAYAAHLYRAREGRWPASLDELPEDVGPDTRTDPFTGRDFGYQMTPEGPRIYSHSENGTDDGGAHSSKWDDEAVEGESDDHVFWPPQSRPM